MNYKNLFTSLEDIDKQLKHLLIVNNIDTPEVALSTPVINCLGLVGDHLPTFDPRFYNNAVLAILSAQQDQIEKLKNEIKLDWKGN